ncbi:YheC/YheD family endospore coat-associated protein [Paenibacillus arenilitoris]|uniref:YheC/YheD family protein n=1 Tax=Paenibacillus arenilitoris TaxID=2772299 RepID=A0A927CRI1_9BACL|nr:YheC/YheD family protein [Paenibacillus arenilitoris]MBD2870596.1 YheC/YheD family protein [Paenibacillus arenilitoris]
MADRRLIGIMVASKTGRRKILKLYQRYCACDAVLFAFTPADIRWKNQHIVGLQLSGGSWREKAFPFPDAVYNQCYNKSAAAFRPLIDKIGIGNCFNAINRLNKWEVYQLLSQSELKAFLPDAFLCDEEKLLALVKQHRLLYLKPFYGNKGNGVYRIERMDNGDIHLSEHSVAPAYICRNDEQFRNRIAGLADLKDCLVQRGIRLSRAEGRYFDSRALVQKNIRGEWSLSALACRTAYENYFNTSIVKDVYAAEELFSTLYSANEKLELMRSMETISLAAANMMDNHLGLFGELSVDFAIDADQRLWIIELNGKPQKMIYNQIRNVKHKHRVYSRPIEYAYYLAGYGRG